MKTYCMHEEIRYALVVVALDKVDVHTPNNNTIKTIFTRRTDFSKPRVSYKGLETLDSNVNSIDCANKQRQKRITATSFHEYSSGLV